ncbi:MAG: hypothetical protein L6R28_01370 [Planctomycetes bacterium]|nr:hypothetical protein [Planctomycetota bacterium]
MRTASTLGWALVFAAGIALAEAGEEPAVFVKKGQIWYRGTDGSERALTTDSPNHGNSSPALSPDGKRVTFVRDLENDPLQVMVLDVDRGEPSVRKLSTSGYPENRDWRTMYVHSAPHWSSDSKQVCFWRGGSGTGGHFWVVDVEKPQQRRVERGQEYKEVPWALFSDPDYAALTIPSLSSEDPEERRQARQALQRFLPEATLALYEAYEKNPSAALKEIILGGSAEAWKADLLEKLTHTQIEFGMDGPLNTSLKELGEKAGITITLDQSVRSQDFKVGYKPEGRITPAAALRALARQAGLVFELKDQAVLVRKLAE